MLIINEPIHALLFLEDQKELYVYTFCTMFVPTDEHLMCTNLGFSYLKTHLSAQFNEQEKFVSKLKSLQVTYAEILHGLSLYDRLRVRTPHRLVVCLYLAHKFIVDRPYNLNVWAEVMHVQKQSLKVYEIQVLEELQYNLCVPQQEINQHHATHLILKTMKSII